MTGDTQRREFLQALKDMADGTREWSAAEISASSSRIGAEIRAHDARLAALRCDASAAKGFKVAALERKVKTVSRDLARDVAALEELVRASVLPRCRTAASRAEWMLLHAEVVGHLRALSDKPTADPAALLDACNACAAGTPAFARAAAALAAHWLRVGDAERAAGVLQQAEHRHAAKAEEPVPEFDGLRSAIEHQTAGWGALTARQVAAVHNVLRVDAESQLVVDAHHVPALYAAIGLPPPPPPCETDAALVVGSVLSSLDSAVSAALSSAVGGSVFDELSASDIASARSAFDRLTADQPGLTDERLGRFLESMGEAPMARAGGERAVLCFEEAVALIYGRRQRRCEEWMQEQAALQARLKVEAEAAAKVQREAQAAEQAPMPLCRT